MAAKNEAKIKFTADTQEFNSQIKQANSTMAAMRAALSLNEAEFKNTGDAAEYLKNKQTALNTQLEANRAKQEALNGKLEAAKSIYGENSSEAQALATKLTQAKTEEQKLISSLNECNSALEAQAAAADDTADEMDDLTDATDEAGDAAQDNAKGGWTTARGVLANLASGAITAVIGKLKEAATAVINLGTEFTASMSNVQALSGATASEMARLEETAKELGRTTIFSASDVSDAFGYMALAGWDTADMLDGIDGVLNLAASSGMDLAEASDIVTDYLTAFGLSAADSGQFVDQMAYAMSHSNTNVEQLGEAYKNVAATAGSLGYSVEDTTAALMTMANAGVKGGEAGTGLSTIMTRLATDTKGCASALSEYGIEIYDSQGNMNSLSSILNGMAGIWGDLTDQEQAALAKTIAGTSQYSKFQTIMNGLSAAAAESGQSFNDYTEALENCSGTANDMTAVMNDNLAGDMKALGSAAEGLGLALFDYFEGPLRGAAELATDAINWITDAIQPNEDLLMSFIDDIAESNAKTKDAIDAARDSVDNLDDSAAEIEYYSDLITELSQKTELTEWEHYQLNDAVSKLAKTVPGLAEVYDEVNGTFSVTNQELQEMLTNAKNIAIQNAVMEAQKELYAQLANAELEYAKATNAVNAARDEYDAVYDSEADSAERVADSYMHMTAAQSEAVGKINLAGQAQKAAQDNIDAAKAGLEELDATVATLTQEYGYNAEAAEAATTATSGQADASGDAADAAGELTEEEAAAAEAAEQYAKTVTDSYNSMVSGIDSAVDRAISLMDEFSGGAEITAEEIQANLQSQIEGLSSWKDNMETLGALAGSGMSQALYDYLVEMGPQSANLVQTLVDTLAESPEQFAAISAQWGEALELRSDALDLASYTQAGKNMAELTGEGIASGAPEAKAAAATLANGIIDPLMQLGPNAQKPLLTLKETTGNTLQQTTENAQTETETLQETVQTGFEAAADAADTALSGIPESASSAMSDAVYNVQNGISQIASALSVTLRGPNIQVPHFQLNGVFDAKTGRVPEVHVDWWAKGGIFQRPTIFPNWNGVGEAGPEAVLPIDRLQDYVTEAIEASSGGNTINVYMDVDGAQDPEAWAADFARELKREMRAS